MRINSFFYCKNKRFMILLNGHVNDQSFALLVKWFNTLPSQGSIHGFETRTGYHMFMYLTLLQDVEFLQSILTD